MLFEEDYPDYCLVLVLIVFAWVDLLQKFACLAAVLSNEASSISHEEFSALVAEFASSDVGVIVAFVEFSENLFESTSDVVVDPDIVGGEEEDVVGH